ncbi:glycosyltransferase [Microbacterium gorillae]|uniref:glycosyltransferase n=1 Tax=Microbacterium gorillae TaxID=1231063 RepID=UPI003D97AFEF
MVGVSRLSNGAVTRVESNTPRISVCMAAYNGARYIREQLDSILRQLDVHDEVVIVDDRSSDDTVAVIESMRDPRIRVLRSASNQGYVRAFERAIGEARGEIIFLSDQDDLWVDGRVQLMANALTDAELVVSNFSTFGGPITAVQSKRLSASTSTHHLRNILLLWIGVRLYFGCCMAFRSEMRERLLPFPSYLNETHDQWIGYVANADGSVRHLSEDTVSRRIHDNNATVKSARSLPVILAARVRTGRAILEAWRRRARRRR